jgi:hypothetical protein
MKQIFCISLSIFSLFFIPSGFGQHSNNPKLFHVSLHGSGLFASPYAQYNEKYTPAHEDENFALNQGASSIIKSMKIQKIIVYKSDSTPFREYHFDTNGLVKSILYCTPYTTRRIEVTYFHEENSRLQSTSVLSEKDKVQRIDSLFVFAQDSCTTSKLICWKSGRYLNAQNEFYNSTFPEFGKKGAGMVNNYYFSLSESKPVVKQPTLGEAPFRTNYPEDTLLLAYTETAPDGPCSSETKSKVSALEEENFQEPTRYIQPFHGCGSTISSSWIEPGAMTKSGLPLEYLLVNHSFMSGGIQTNITTRQQYYYLQYGYF